MIANFKNNICNFMRITLSNKCYFVLTSVILSQHNNTQISSRETTFHNLSYAIKVIHINFIVGIGIKSMGIVQDWKCIKLQSHTRKYPDEKREFWTNGKTWMLFKKNK